MSTRLLVVAVLAGASPVYGQPVYQIINLNVSGTSQTSGEAVNNAGQVAGLALTYDIESVGFRTAPGGVWSLDTSSFAGPAGQAQGINASGQVTGYYYFGPGASGVTHAFRTSTANITDPVTDLGTLPGSDTSHGYGINASGQVAGDVRFRTTYQGNVSYIYKAFRTTANGSITTDLGTFPGGQLDASAFAINNSGQVTGQALTASGQTHAFRTSATGGISADGTDLGTLLSGNYSAGHAINDSGQVAGESTSADGRYHAFRTSPTGRVGDQGASLDALTPGYSSDAYAINALGEVVGKSGTASDQHYHAFVFTDMMWDLNALIPPGTGWLLTDAYGINDNLWITGEGLFNGQRAGFLLIPSDTNSMRAMLTPVPEPSSLVLGAIAAAVAARVIRRRRPAVTAA